MKCSLFFVRRDSSRAEFTPLGEDHAAEYYFASDASAIVENTNRVIYLEVFYLELKCIS